MDRLYRVKFVSGDKIYELYARHVYQADMYGFIVIEDFVFGEKTSLVVDPSEERLKDEFDDVIAAHIPMHAVLRIDEVKKQGIAKISELDSSGKVAHFPSAIYAPQGNNDGCE